MVRIARFSLLVGVLGVLSLIPRHSVYAEPPTHEYAVDIGFTATLPAAVTGCDFDVTVQQTGTGTVTVFYDQSGNVTSIRTSTPRSSVTFSANGHTYTSVTPASSSTYYVNGTPTTTVINGLEAHLVIPGMGVVGQAVGHFVTDLTTGQVTQNGQWSLSPVGNWSPAVCALFAP